MLNFLANPWVVAFVAPLIASALTIFVKWSSRNDRHARFEKEDCAIGLELGVTGIFTLLAAVPTFAAKTPSALNDSNVASSTELVALTFLIALAFTLGLWFVSTVVRKIGWVDKQTLRLWTGLVIPLIYGFAVLLITSAWISSNI